jgi:hypothetical protein
MIAKRLVDDFIAQEAVAYCAEHGVDAVHGECILLYLHSGPALHRLHRGLRRLLGRLPR